MTAFIIPLFIFALFFGCIISFFVWLYKRTQLRIEITQQKLTSINGLSVIDGWKHAQIASYQTLFPVLYRSTHTNATTPVFSLASTTSNKVDLITITGTENYKLSKRDILINNNACAFTTFRKKGKNHENSSIIPAHTIYFNYTDHFQSTLTFFTSRKHFGYHIQYNNHQFTLQWKKTILRKIFYLLNDDCEIQFPAEVLDKHLVPIIHIFEEKIFLQNNTQSFERAIYYITTPNIERDFIQFICALCHSRVFSIHFRT